MAQGEFEISTGSDRKISEELREIIVTALEDDKAEELVSIDLAGKTSIADYMIVASGRSARHVTAMADHLQEKVKAKIGERPPAEGLNQGDWVLLDAGDVIVHLFRPEVRAFYNIEKMWGVDLDSSADSATA